jgi:hypothetical protein
MFTVEELELIDKALTEYWAKHNKELDSQKTKRRNKWDWHISIMNDIFALQYKISNIRLKMRLDEELTK